MTTNYFLDWACGYWTLRFCFCTVKDDPMLAGAEQLHLLPCPYTTNQSKSTGPLPDRSIVSTHWPAIRVFLLKEPKRGGGPEPWAAKEEGGHFLNGNPITAYLPQLFSWLLRPITITHDGREAHLTDNLQVQGEES